MGGWARVGCTGRYDNISFKMKTTYPHLLMVKDRLHVLVCMLHYWNPDVNNNVSRSVVLTFCVCVCVCVWCMCV